MAAGATNISRYGYADLGLERVASDAGYTRGALYHLFDNKEALVLSVVKWVQSAWHDEVGFLLADKTDPVETLIAVARGSAVYSRHDPARALTRLRPEFAGKDHPIAKALELTNARRKSFRLRLAHLVPCRCPIRAHPCPFVGPCGFVCPTLPAVNGAEREKRRIRPCFASRGLGVRVPLAPHGAGVRPPAEWPLAR